QQYLDLGANEQTLESRIIDVDVLDVDLFDGLDMGFDLPQNRLDVGELALDCQREGGNCALHSLQDVDAQEVNEAFLAVGLPEEAFSAADSGAVFLVI